MLLFTSPEAHILSLATDKDGNIYAGSAPDGIVYKITPDGKSSVFYDAPESGISALATDSQGKSTPGRRRREPSTASPPTARPSGCWGGRQRAS